MAIFWYSIGSTYSFLSVLRLGEVSTKFDILFNWQPFNVRVMVREMNKSPFANKPAKLPICGGTSKGAQRHIT
jgi:2-hydroxychromene-2-carboxylate isomerase